MGKSKTLSYSDEQLQMAEAAKALAHPARLAIIEALAEAKSCVCGDLVTEVGLAQATVSQHLKVLKAAGLIQGSIEGTSVCYCLNPGRWKELRDKWLHFFDLSLTPQCNTENC